MSNRVERLRMWLLGGAVFLMLVIAAFLGSAHYLRQRLRSYLPARLGTDVKIDSTGVTWAHADEQGRTIYEIHAAKEIEHNNGVIALHDVWIALYGPKGDRADRICGADFEYDQNAQLVRAAGVVHIDLQGAPKGGQTAASATPAQADCPSHEETTGPKVLHVTTSGLVFMEKLGLAATGEPIEFQLGGITGHATGADYNSDSGVLMLHSAVSMSGIEGGRPVAMTASTAELDNLDHEAFLTHATYESQGRTAQAEQVTLHSRPDGTLARIEAQGNATAKVDGRTVASQRADVTLNGAGQPQSVVLTGGVQYASDEPLRQVRGQADSATIGFDSQAKPQPEHAVFTGAVHMVERLRVTDAAREPWSTRDLTAVKLEAELVPAGPGKSQLQDAEATGNAHLTMVDNGSLPSARGAATTELSADDLKAHLIDTGDPKQQPQLDTIAGRGHTVLHQVSADGVDQTSAGDTLDVKCRPKTGCGAGAGVLTAGGAAAGKAASGSAKAGQQIADLLWSAVQQGHVTMTRRAPARSGTQNAAAGQPGREDVEHAIAERAVYDGDRDQMTLTGGVELTEAESVLWGNQVVLDRATGNVQATGGVKVDYVQEASRRRDGGQGGGARNPTPNGETTANGTPGLSQQGGPTHILADRADLEHETGIATFYGKPVRLWQDGDQVQAPVIEFSQAQKRLIARSEASTGWSGAAQPAQVHTVLMRAGSGSPGAAQLGAGTAAAAKCGPAKASTGKTGAAAQGQDVVRIASGGLVYSDLLRQAEFTGGFRADTVDTTIRANQAIVYLQQPGDEEQEGPAGSTKSAAASTGTGAAAVPSLAGKVERIVATGHVAIAQPGLRATGERLVYTASDEAGMLTGDRSAPPRAVDARGTTTTGAALRFQNSCDAAGGVSVEALGAVPGEPVQRVHTESRIRDEGKKEKGKQ